MKILLIGSGGREHAIAWKLVQSPKVEHIYVSLGNAGTALLEKCENIALAQHDDLLQFALKNKIDLTVVGPEQPLVEDIVGLFKKHHLPIFGPAGNGALLEGSKIFAKNFMKQYHVATATYETFDEVDKAMSYLKSITKYPIVIKADGLAAGKGVEICQNFTQATACIQLFMTNNVFKHRNPSIVIEEYLTGVEASIICVTDGKAIKPLISSQDHKTIYENNQGPNTGGMGAVCPNQHVNEKNMADFVTNIMNPTMKGIIKEQMDFHGFVFFGVMITHDGCKCLEYNVRMGDPECQSIVPLMDFDLLEMMLATLDNKLEAFQLKWKPGVCINVVLVSKGYPGKYALGFPITMKGNPLVFFSGSKKQNNQIITAGGRVLSVVALGDNIKQAVDQVYRDVQTVEFEGKQYRKDIGGA